MYFVKSLYNKFFYKKYIVYNFINVLIFWVKYLFMDIYRCIGSFGDVIMIGMFW